MVTGPPRAIIVGITSDIGLAVARRWLQAGVSVVGSYRRPPGYSAQSALQAGQLFPCDFCKDESIDAFVSQVGSISFGWNRLLVCPGTMNPIGPFESVDFDEWEAGFRINFLSTMRVIRGLLPLRERAAGPPVVLVFAGGGVNSAPRHFSAYTAAKIALIKMIELLAEEMSDTSFVILGPGWVETKIHEETLRASVNAVEAARETRRRLESKDFVPMQRVVDCIDWAISEDGGVTSGRNFSVVYDRWGETGLREKLTRDQNMYKLRRYGNDE
jgi:NAD(P)-dependent dehydrogenase (short-subunit alcohol dehydrogenase family)